MLTAQEINEWDKFPDEGHGMTGTTGTTTPAPAEQGFVIESNKPEGTSWLYIMDTHVGWTGSSDQALRFARKEDGEQFLKAFVGTEGYHVVALGAC